MASSYGDEEDARPHEHALRLPAWQRSLRHLRSIAFAGLPFEPSDHGSLFIELHALPASANVRLQLSCSSSGHVSAMPFVVTAVSAVSGLIHRSALAAFSLRPQWPVDVLAADWQRRAGSLQGCILVLKQAPPRHAPADAEPHAVLTRRIIFSELTHLQDADAASVCRLLPPTGGLVLEFFDGACACMADLEPLAAAKMLQPEHASSAACSSAASSGTAPRAVANPSSTAVGAAGVAATAATPATAATVAAAAAAASAAAAATPTSPSPSPLARATAFCDEVERLQRLLHEAEAANAQERAQLEAHLSARAQSEQRRLDLRRHAAGIDQLRAAHAAALDEADEVRGRVERMRQELDQGARQLAQSSGVAERLDAAASASRDAASASHGQLSSMQQAEGAMRRVRLCELAAALPVYVAVNARAGVAGEAAAGGGAAATTATGGGGRMSLFAAASGVGIAPSMGQSRGSAAKGGHGGSGAGGGGPDGVEAAFRDAPSVPSGVAGNDEEEVAALLGAAAQLVVHSARLLSVTLRYPLRLCASRSEICELPPAAAPHPNGKGGGSGQAGSGGGGGGFGASFPGYAMGSGGWGTGATAAAPPRGQIYPLYTRGSEPRRLSEGLVLFCRNVQQLLEAVGDPPGHQPPKQIVPALHAFLQRLPQSDGPPLSVLLMPHTEGAAHAAGAAAQMHHPPGTPTTPATPATPAGAATPGMAARPTPQQPQTPSTVESVGADDGLAAAAAAIATNIAPPPTLPLQAARDALFARSTRGTARASADRLVGKPIIASPD